MPPLDAAAAAVGVAASRGIGPDSAAWRLLLGQVLASCLHTGHSRLLASQGSMHLAWNLWQTFTVFAGKGCE
jgi:hypothetical protein